MVLLMNAQYITMIRLLIRNTPKSIIRNSSTELLLPHKYNSVRNRTFGTKHCTTVVTPTIPVIPKRTSWSNKKGISILYCRTLSTESAPTSTVKSGTDIEIYYGTLTSQIRVVKLFSLLTSFTGLAAQPVLMQKVSEMSSLGVGIAIGSFVGFFTFVTPFLLHWLTKKYVTYLHYNPETQKYTATTLSLFLRDKKTLFSANDVTVPEISGMFTSFKVNNKTDLFVDPRFFSHPEHYGKIMGYDKPIDFKLEDKPANSKS